GFVDWTEIHTLYAFSRIFVSASLSEMHPMTYIEATMSGIPLVTRKDDSCMDLVLDGKSGYLAETDSGMAQRVDELLSDRKKLESFGKASLENSLNFIAEYNVNGVLAVYKIVLDQFKKSAGLKFQTKHTG
ncbi:MAG: glycosyltransferase, partial [Spirochaetaceae bacterium]